jgi:NRAMP (natural resistance-associated macrophage protein)-like metal ion transporter
MLALIVGPGIIAANADNDAGGILGYSQAGLQYRYGLLWILVLSTISLGVCQEICARMAAVTGKGLADLIREEYGVKVSLFAMVVLFIANFATTVSEFAGITAAIEMFNTSSVGRLVIVPLVALAVWYLVTRGSYKRVEKVLLYASFLYLTYIGAAILSHPQWPHVMLRLFFPGHITVNHDYIFMIINVVGTTITPWGQFYIQSSVRDKGIRPSQYGITRIDVLFGAFFTNFIAFFIIVACGATLYPIYIRNPNAFDINDAGQIALALRPLAGNMAAILFALGLFNASVFGAITVPVSTAYAITESLGWESTLGKRAREAPIFNLVLTLLMAGAAATVMIWGRRPDSLGMLIILPNIVGGMLLPIILVLMQLLVNKRRLMGDFINSKPYNIVAWATIIVLTILSVVLVVTQLTGG